MVMEPSASADRLELVLGATSGTAASAMVWEASGPTPNAMSFSPPPRYGVATATGMLLPVLLWLPYWPLLFLPHAASVPFPQSARLSPAAVIAVTVLPANTPEESTATGTRLSVLPPLPSSPSPLLPHAASVPFEQSARLCDPPATMAVTVLPESTPEPVISTGTPLSAVPLLPSWPE